VAVLRVNLLREGFSCRDVLLWLFPTIFGVVLPQVLCSSARADTFFYVDSAWPGSQSGSASAPWTRLDDSAWNAINSALQNGNVTIYFSANGQYGGPSTIDLTSGYSPFGTSILTFDGASHYNSSELSPSWATNTGTNSCLVQSFNAENGAHLKYSNIKIHGFRIRQTDAGKLVAICGDNWTVENCDMAHTSSATDGPGLYVVPTADLAHEGTAYYSQPITNIVIRNNVVHDTFGEAMYIGAGGARPGQPGSGYPSHSHILIESNTIFRASIYGGQGDGIEIKGGIEFLTIRANEIYNLSSFNAAYDVRGIDMHGQYQPHAGQKCLVERNRIHDCSGLLDAAIGIDNDWGTPQGLTLRNNLIYNIKANRGAPAGIKLYGSQDVVGIFNNTIYNCAGYGINVQRGAQAAVINNLVVYNNVGKIGRAHV